MGRIQRRHIIKGDPTVILIPPNEHAGIEFTDNRGLQRASGLRARCDGKGGVRHCGVKEGLGRLRRLGGLHEGGACGCVSLPAAAHSFWLSCSFAFLPLPPPPTAISPLPFALRPTFRYRSTHLCMLGSSRTSPPPSRGGPQVKDAVRRAPPSLCFFYHTRLWPMRLLASTTVHMYHSARIVVREMHACASTQTHTQKHRSAQGSRREKPSRPV
ncbi:hypothetical protein LSCM1_04072 [Leishmania martiniquensis]|uniref:Uncharacterized protein n=1 Tax=Leishmania martiniquensis TaxID=1580590 RepID=A0A836H2H3_9TRYP|nr:hypothetical protein LSCM1_04072 [Leishmania martiniquensis]